MCPRENFQNTTLEEQPEEGEVPFERTIMKAIGREEMGVLM
jgi:hypothetical protein